MSDQQPPRCCETSREPATTRSDVQARSITRSYSDLNPLKFVTYVALLTTVRAVVLQPLNATLTRVRVASGSCPATGSTPALQMARRMWRREGPRSLLLGLPANILALSISEAAYLLQFEAFRLGSLNTESWMQGFSQNTRDFLSGYAAETTRQCLNVPFTVIATRQIVDLCRPRFWSVCSSLLREGGVRAFFCGLGTSLMIGPLWTATWWGMYGSFKRSLYSSCGQYLSDDSPHWWRMRSDNWVLNTAASVAASGLSAALFTPFLVVRTKMQAIPGGGGLRFVVMSMVNESLSAQKNAVEAVGGSGIGRRRHSPVVPVSLWRAGRVFYAGMSFTVSQCILDGLASSWTYELAKMWSETHIHSSS